VCVQTPLPARHKLYRYDMSDGQGGRTDTSSSATVSAGWAGPPSGVLSPACICMRACVREIRWRLCHGFSYDQLWRGGLNLCICMILDFMYELAVRMHAFGADRDAVSHGV
jgi:hypothetical protein